MALWSSTFLEDRPGSGMFLRHGYQDALSTPYGMKSITITGICGVNSYYDPNTEQCIQGSVTSCIGYNLANNSLC